MHKYFLTFVVTASLSLAPVLSFAQGILVQDSSDPQTLVSSPPGYLLESKHSLQTSLVDIQAVGAPSMQTENGKTGMASTIHYGHGVIIDSSGIIVTNTHIIANAEHIYVSLNEDGVFEAVVLYNSKSDFSFIKIDPPYPLNTISWGDASLLQTGNPIIALANSDTDPRTVLSGEVTNLIKGQHSGNVNYLELKVNLNPGDSGGPIMDEQGDLLGLIMAGSKSDNSQTIAISSDKIQREFLKYKGSILVPSNSS